MDGERLRVVVADDHPVAREALALTINAQADLTLAGEARDGAQAVERIRERHPHVALVDLRMPKLDGLQVLHAVTREELPTRVLLFSAYCDGADIHEAVVAGAAGYVTKWESLTTVCQAIRRVAAGERHLSVDAQSALLEHIRLRAIRRPLLTARELDILRLTAEGTTSAEIGRRLHLSQSTVKNHQQHLYDKLGVPNAPAAIHQAMQRGLLR